MSTDRGSRRNHRSPFNIRSLENERSISSELHIIDKPQVAGFARFGGKEFMALQREALGYDCQVERDLRRGHKSGYIFTSCDTGPAGAECRNLAEINEELDNFRG